MFILLSGKAPFDGDNDEAIINATIRGDYAMTDPIWNGISADAKALLNKMLTYDFRDRIFAQDALNDKWFETAPEQRSSHKVLGK